MKLDFLKENLIHPDTGQGVLEWQDDKVIFNDNFESVIANNIPIIVSDKSLFSIQEILDESSLTQDKAYREKSLKNNIRRALPSLSKDFAEGKRYANLANKLKQKRGLVIGAGDKIEFYNEIFKNSLIITSDVHLQFQPDIVLDAHQIPFRDESFDFIIACQVLEHTLEPWNVAEEMQRVVKEEGYLLVEVPFNFPYHSPPFDFFRFTFTGLRSLFAKCELINYEAPEGVFSTVATFNSQLWISLFSNRYLKMFMLFISRFLFGWMKYLDLVYKKSSYRSSLAPKGFSMTFKKDNMKRTKRQLLNEYYKLT